MSSITLLAWRCSHISSLFPFGKKDLFLKFEVFLFLFFRLAIIELSERSEHTATNHTQYHFNNENLAGLITFFEIPKGESIRRSPNSPFKSNGQVQKIPCGFSQFGFRNLTSFSSFRFFDLQYTLRLYCKS